MDLYKKQNGLCALSGEKLTFNLEIGKVSKTNASIDKVDPSKGYSVDNVQLVCRCLNGFKVDTNQEEFIEWCRKVVDYAEKKKLSP